MNMKEPRKKLTEDQKKDRRKAYNAKYRFENQEKIRVASYKRCLKIAERKEKYYESLREMYRVKFDEKKRKQNERDRKIRKENPDKTRALDKSYYYKNKERLINNVMRWHKDNKDKTNSYAKKAYEKRSKNLTDVHIINNLIRRGFNRDFITGDIINIQREAIKLKRYIKKYS